MALILPFDNRDQIDRGLQGREHSSDAAVFRNADIARLEDDCHALIPKAERLERLVGDLHKYRRSEEANRLATGPGSDINRHLIDEAGILRVAKAFEGRNLHIAIERARTEHAALRELLAPVVRGPRSIGRNRFPTRLNGFVLSSIVLCEFIRLHAKFKREELYPLLATLETCERAEVQRPK